MKGASGASGPSTPRSQETLGMCGNSMRENREAADAHTGRQRGTVEEG